MAVSIAADETAWKAGSGTMSAMKTARRYADLKKPSWSPPAAVFGPVWTVLYVIIAVSFGAVFVHASTGDLPWMTALPFGINLAANFAFTPLQFGLRSNALASVDILVVLGTIVWMMVAVFPSAPWIAYAQIPYLLWVGFATCLQLTITWMNRRA